MTITDRQGLEMTAANAEAAGHYDDTVETFLGFGTETGPRLKAALAADAELVMGLCIRGYFLQLFANPVLALKAQQALAAAERAMAEHGATGREQIHVTALGAWCAGDMARAAALLENILVEHPRDVLAVRLAHFLHFYIGGGRQMRDSVARVLHGWDDGVPGHGFVMGMYAFGLEESGEFAAAEAAGRRAVEINPADIWAVHAVAHVMEMQGRLREGIDWIGGLEKSWDACNNFRYHVWWHRALFHLELGEHDAVLTLYDQEIRADQTDDYLDMSNGIALLWRLEDAGVDVGDRWEELADKSEARVEGRVLAFADAHYMMALAATGRQEPANRMLASMRQFADGRDDTQASVTGKAGMPLAQAILAYRAGEYRKAAELLLPVRYDIRRLGGSNAQRDVFAQILVQAAVKAGRLSLARALLSERTAAMPNRPSAWALQAQVQEKLGDADAAAASRKRADQAARG